MRKEEQNTRQMKNEGNRDFFLEKKRDEHSCFGQILRRQLDNEQHEKYKMRKGS